MYKSKKTIIKPDGSRFIITESVLKDEFVARLTPHLYPVDTLSDEGMRKLYDYLTEREQRPGNHEKEFNPAYLADRWSESNVAKLRHDYEFTGSDIADLLTDTNYFILDYLDNKVPDRNDAYIRYVYDSYKLHGLD